ncbi:ABC transporter ATP-binding protein [Candidatus Gottesmanbacteria bacterium]|nr:ABC transporter ATP-binding protein [Candidatus Gottesmanbacteria bacterium]
MDNVVEVKNLTKRFGKFTAVSNISFTIKEGEIVGFLGQNGAGKTTTINMLLGLLTPTKGTVRILGHDLSKERSKVLEQMNFSSSYVKMPWRLTVWENLFTYALLYNVKNPKQRIAQLLKIFEIEDLKDKQAGFLSAGQTTRVALSKAFINNPRLVLLDEPTASLDPDIAEKVRDFLKKIQKEEKVTMLFTSHNMAEVEDVCDRVIFIQNGKIIAQDTPAGLAKRIKTSKVRFMMIDGMKRTIEYCKEYKYPYQEDGRYITISVKEHKIAEFINNLAKKGISYSEITIDKPSLEDYFLSQTYENK